MNTADCLEDLMNLLMTSYSIIVIEHYMVLTMILKAHRGADVQDQLINVLRDHFDKEIRIAKSTDRLRQCLGSDGVDALDGFINNAREGFSLVNDPEFLSSYVNNFAESLRAITNYMIAHDELTLRLISKLREVVFRGINTLNR